MNHDMDMEYIIVDGNTFGSILIYQNFLFKMHNEGKTVYFKCYSPRYISRIKIVNIEKDLFQLILTNAGADRIFHKS